MDSEGIIITFFLYFDHFSGEVRIKYAYDLELPCYMFELKEIKKMIKNFPEIRKDKGSLNFRREIRTPNNKDKIYKLWNEIYAYLANLDVRVLNINISSHESEINEKIGNYLKKKFSNVIIHNRISGEKHIDITVDSQVLIEIKKIRSNTNKDELVGQINEDMRITGIKYGIAFGFDLTKKKIYVSYNGLYAGEDGEIRYLIK